MKIEIQPWQTPNFVLGVIPAKERQDWFNPEAAPKWALKEVDVETLSMLCDAFRSDIFYKAGKNDPRNIKG